MKYVVDDAVFVPGLLPPAALKLSARKVVDQLRRIYGTAADLALDPEGATVPESPVGAQTDSSWLRRQNIVGINVRTVGSFWRVVHYCLTLPGTIGAIHLLPIWEPGVVGSLYGMASWFINAEFFDAELARLLPELNTPARQLKAVVNVVHLMERTIGMEVIPHTDRFSEMVLSRPAYFEWLRRDAKRIVDHRNDLHEEVEDLIHQFVMEHGPAVPPDEAVDANGDTAPGPDIPGRGVFFTPEVEEALRNRILFGAPEDTAVRGDRRGQIIRYVHNKGYEPVPATMGPPYRGLEMDPTTVITDGAGDTWVDYRITKPEAMSRVFGPLTRYKLFERKNDNKVWEIDFDRPRVDVWSYVTNHCAAVQNEFGFDFMRGDMSHVQMRPNGVPARVPEYYDLLSSVKQVIQKTRPSFAYFAETFLAPPGVMAYGHELDHLEASGADVTLGDLQSVAVADSEFSRRLRRYLDIAGTRTVVPCFTLMTGDKDDPRFDEFYLAGNELRLFIGLFLPNVPSYMALGYELRDPHPEPAANEFYSKLYVFHVSSGKNATHGPYRFGNNTPLFERLRRIHSFALEILPEIADEEPQWLLPPDPTAGQKIIAWSLDGSTGTTWVFVANTDTVAAAENVKVPLRGRTGAVRFVWSTVPDPRNVGTESASDGFHVVRQGRGEGRVYEIKRASETAAEGS